MAEENNTNRKAIYFLSGLGADERIFTRLSFPGYEVIFLPWIQPKPNETVQSYALRMAEQIPKNEPFILAGISFGGMLATEIANVRKPKQLILFSTAKSHSEIPLFYRIGGKLGLHRLIPNRLLKRANWLAYYLFGVQEPEDKLLLKTIMSEADPHFIRWAMGAITHWKNHKLPEKFVHIHGTKDKILPYRNVRNAIAITNAGHFMTHTHAGEVNALLKLQTA